MPSLAPIAAIGASLASRAMSLSDFMIVAPQRFAGAADAEAAPRRRASSFHPGGLSTGVRGHHTPIRRPGQGAFSYEGAFFLASARRQGEDGPRSSAVGGGWRRRPLWTRLDRTAASPGRA
jgi:hypothetical protein